MIYFIGNIEEGYFKVGKTNDSIFRRMAVIQCSAPFKLHILKLLPENEVFGEKELHAKFKNLHNSGEWFRFDESLIKEVLSKYGETWDYQDTDAYIERELLKVEGPDVSIKERAEIRMTFNSNDPTYKKILENAKKSRRSPASEVLVFLEANYNE